MCLVQMSRVFMQMLLQSFNLGLHCWEFVLLCFRGIISRGLSVIRLQNLEFCSNLLPLMLTLYLDS